jgi:hypothetical protein
VVVVKEEEDGVMCVSGDVCVLVLSVASVMSTLFFLL